MEDIAYDIISKGERTHWWYRVRRGIVQDLLESFLTKSENNMLLDVGCGTGEQHKVLEQFGAAYGIDFSPKAIGYCKRRGLKNVSVGSVTSLEYETDTFDAVLALDVLEHIENDEKAMLEIHRVLKDGGVFIVFVPCFDSLRGYADIMGQHYRRYTLPILTKRLEASGFVVEKKSYFNFFLSPPIFLVRFLARIFNYVHENENGSGTGILNSIFYHVFNSERRWLGRHSFPFGVSALCVVRKVTETN